MSAPLDRASRLRLVRHARLKLDPRTGKQVLLYPERGLELNETAARVAALCTEERTVAEVLDQMVAAADASTTRVRIEDEVLAFLQALIDRGLLEVKAP